MSKTPNYGLFVTDDASTRFKDWREQMASEANSNMTKIDTALSEKSAHSRAVQITLTADGWSGDAAPYQQQVAVKNLAADANGSIAISSEADATQRAAVRNAQISIGAQADGMLTLNCDGTKPTVDIPAVVILLD